MSPNSPFPAVVDPLPLSVAESGIHQAHETLDPPSSTETKQEDEAEEDPWLHDPINARNWSQARKWFTVVIISSYTFVTPLGSSMMAPALPQIAQHYHLHSDTLTSLTLSIFLLSYAIAPLILAPLSEMYGRTWVLHIGNLFYLIFNLGCAFSPNAGALIALRFLAGFAGSAPIACGGGSVGDLFVERERASAMAAYVMGPLFGPALGPIIGGVIAQKIGFRYIFIVLAGICAVISVVAIPTLQETYAPVIRLRRCIAERGDLEKLAETYPELKRSEGGKLRYIWINITRPVVLLTRSSVCFMLSLYMAFIYGTYYLMFTTFADVYGTIYGFGPAITGLAYLPVGLGFLIATALGGRFGNLLYRKLSERKGGKGKPEYRIPALVIGSFFVPIGLFWYGWTAAAHTHWILPMIGTGIFGFGLLTAFLPIQLYLVDTFKFAASAIAAASVFRAMLGFIFPLFGNQMYAALGDGGGNSLLAGLAILLGIPFPIWLYYHGERLRASNPLSAPSCQ